MNKIRIGILGYDGVAAINLVGPLEAFSNAFQTDETGEQTRCYEVVVISTNPAAGCRPSAAVDGTSPNQFVTDTGVILQGHVETCDDVSFDTIIVPGGRGMRCDETVA